MKKEQLLLDLLKFEISGTFPKDDYNNINDEMTECLIELASKHAVVPLVLDALLKNEMYTIDMQNLYRQSLWFAVMQCEKQTAELNKLCNLFEENKICHIPLKGSVLRNYYPEPWMRTCCDIDVLVKPEELDKAVQVLKNSGYSMEHKGSHDVSFFTENGVHLELHYNVIEREYKIADVSNVLVKVWNYSVAKEGYEYQFEMTNEMFYFYHFAHMAKHFVQGGCGIRPFVDIMFFKKKVNYDKEKLNSLLKEGSILTFANMAEKLAAIWFENEETTSLAKDMQSYILRGGVYGSLENSIVVKQVKTGSKINEMLSKIFVPYYIIKYQYPILQKYKFLLPMFEVCRWCKLIFFKRHRQRSINHLSVNNSITNEQKNSVADLLKKLEL